MGVLESSGQSLLLGGGRGELELHSRMHPGAADTGTVDDFHAVEFDLTLVLTVVSLLGAAALFALRRSGGRHVGAAA